MKISDFDKRVVIEQIRYTETEGSIAADVENILPDIYAHGNFEHRLWQRARYIVDRHNLRPQLDHAAKLSARTRIVALIVAALLGLVGTGYALADSHTVNIYWLLLILLGFNFISMLLWLAGISLNIGGLTTGILTRLTSRFPGLTGSKRRPGTPADRAWLACHYGSNVGKWQFSKIAHTLWLGYLSTGLIVLILLLMVRQIDFVWGTTLLSDTAFENLTGVLSTPLETLGLAVPSANQVQETRIGVAQTLTAEYRYHWAQFLLGALLCYGIIPRALLWCGSTIMLYVERRRFTLDDYLPYYINLRRQLMPLASQGRIVDGDTAAPVIAARSVTTPVPHTVPSEARWVAVELGDDVIWPPAAIKPENNCGQVMDRESQTRVMQQIRSMHCPVIAVATSVTRSPDRGLQRTIADLMSGSEQRWLVLLQNDGHEPVSNTRLAAWYRLAEVCNVPADHVVSMHIS